MSQINYHSERVTLTPLAFERISRGRFLASFYFLIISDRFSYSIVLMSRSGVSLPKGIRKKRHFFFRKRHFQFSWNIFEQRIFLRRCFRKICLINQINIVTCNNYTYVRCLHNIVAYLLYNIIFTHYFNNNFESFIIFLYTQFFYKGCRHARNFVFDW